MNKKIEYTGKYGDLTKKYGYTFQKLYASNYKCYCKGNNKYGRRIWIWVKCNEITYDDLHGLSPYVFEFLKGYKLDKDFLPVIIDRGTGVITLDDRTFDPYILPDKEIYEWFDKHRRYVFTQEDIDLINELWDTGLIKLTEWKK